MNDTKRTMPYLMREKTRHGKIIWYVRKGAGPRIRINEIPGTAAFRSAYEEALAGKVTPKPQSLVYFAKCGDRVKIGVSLDPRKRVASFRTGSAHKVQIYYVTPGGRDLEGQLHKQFANRRLNGEWFLWSQEIREWIEVDEANRLSVAKQMADAT